MNQTQLHVRIYFLIVKSKHTDFDIIVGKKGSDFPIPCRMWCQMNM